MRLRAALPHWKAASEWAGKLVRFGLVPEWIKHPPLILKEDSFTVCSRHGMAALPAMTTEIEKLIAIGSVVETKEIKDENMVVSLMFH